MSVIPLQTACENVELTARQAPSFFSIVYAYDTDIHKTEFCPRGKAREWMEADRMTPLPAYETPASREERIATFAKGGWTGPTNWCVHPFSSYSSPQFTKIATDTQAQVQSQHS
jgi:hypothetical protein